MKKITITINYFNSVESTHEIREVFTTILRNKKLSTVEQYENYLTIEYTSDNIDKLLNYLNKQGLLFDVIKYDTQVDVIYYELNYTNINSIVLSMPTNQATIELLTSENIL